MQTHTRRGRAMAGRADGWLCARLPAIYISVRDITAREWIALRLRVAHTPLSRTRRRTGFADRAAREWIALRLRGAHTQPPHRTRRRRAVLLNHARHAPRRLWQSYLAS